MHLALLGTDRDVLALAAAARASGHEIVWFNDVRPQDVDTLRELIPPELAPSPTWEPILDHAAADAVIVGRGMSTDDLRAEQLKRLATDAVPMLIVHPIADSVLTYYEIDMIRRETGALVRHYNPLMGQPALTDAAAWLRDGHPELGAIHQVSYERRVEAVDRASVLRAISRDSELLASIAGDIRKVSAVGPRTSDESFASTQVQMTTAGPASLHWTVAPKSGAATDVEITFVGERGRTKLPVDENDDGGGAVKFNAPSTAIHELAAAVAETDPALRKAASTWDKATQSMEVVDAIELSLQKGRTMEVHQQQLTEQLAFRGTMAAIGCGLLLVGFAVLVIATVVGGVETVLGQPLMPSWPGVLLAILAVFLLLQAVPLLVTKKKHASTPASGADSDAN